MIYMHVTYIYMIHIYVSYASFFKSLPSRSISNFFEETSILSFLLVTYHIGPIINFICCLYIHDSRRHFKHRSHTVSHYRCSHNRCHKCVDTTLLLVNNSNNNNNNKCTHTHTHTVRLKNCQNKRHDGSATALRHSLLGASTNAPEQ